jgi:hypothetical protein
VIFDIINDQSNIPIDREMWNRAFRYGARELGIENFAAGVTCVFTPFVPPKMQPVSVGRTVKCSDGAIFAVMTPPSPMTPFLGLPLPLKQDFYKEWHLVETFFHELTHVRQLLTGDLVVKPRSRKWKGQKWGTKVYSFAPWEEEANSMATRLRDGFKKAEVIAAMARPGANAYVVAQALNLVFPSDEVFEITSQFQIEDKRP